jgi:hypothetical protein
MHQATLKALEKAVAATGHEITDMTDSYVSVGGVDFWSTRYGWIRAVQDRDGSYSTSTTEAYRKRSGRGGVVGRNLDTVAYMAGVPTYRSPAAAVRAYFGEAA